MLGLTNSSSNCLKLSSKLPIFLYEVDGTSISWTDALADMNEALEEGSYEWRYALDEGVDAEVRPLVIVPVQ